MNVQVRRQDRRDTNPVFNDRKLKLGTFGTNLDRGCAISDHRRRAGDQLAEHAGARQALRGDGVRGAGADRALARLRRRAPTSTARASNASPGPSAIGASTQVLRHLRHLARADHPSGDGGQAGHHHRPRHRRPLRAQHRHRLEPAGDRDVRLAADGARRPLRLRGGVARRHEAAVDARRAVRFRGQVLQHQEGLSAAEADPAAVSGGDECRRLRPRPALRRQVLRHGLRGVRLARLRRLQGQGRRLPRSWRARNTAARSRSGATPMWCRARPRRRRRRYYDEYVNQKGDWDAVEQPGRHHDRQRQDAAAGGAGRDEEAFHRRLGRLSDHRHAGADRRRPDHHVEDGTRRHAAELAALRLRPALVPEATSIRWWCRPGCDSSAVMAGLVPAIHDLAKRKAWIAAQGRA